MRRGTWSGQSLVTAAAVLLSACADGPATGPAERPSFNADAPAGVAARRVTIDFTSFGEGRFFEPTFYRSDGIVFPAEACGPAGCAAWFVGFVQGDAALVGTPSFGPVNATFTRPVSNLSLAVAPAIQGTATYVLSAFTESGRLLGTTSVTVTQDSGDPASSGYGYFTIGLTNLPGPAKSFTLDNVFVRSSFPQNTEIPYGVSSISYSHLVP